MILRRFRQDEIGTFGTLELDDQVFFTVEKPWKNNEPFESCLPDGEYSLIPHGEYGKDGNVLAIVNRDMGITHYQEPDSVRYACLIHTANYPSDVVGCVGLGQDYIADKNMITNSRKSIKEFYAKISPTESHNLTIETSDYLKD